MAEHIERGPPLSGRISSTYAQYYQKLVRVCVQALSGRGGARSVAFQYQKETYIFKRNSTEKLYNHDELKFTLP